MFMLKLKKHTYWLCNTLKLIQLDETSVETVPDYCYEVMADEYNFPSGTY